MKKLNLPELTFRILILITFLFTTKYFFQLKSKQKNGTINTKRAERNNNLRVVNKIDTYIEEQAFLFSKIEQQNENKVELLNKIEKNIENLEKEAKIKQVENLINKNKIEEIKLNIKSIKQLEKNI